MPRQIAAPDAPSPADERAPAVVVVLATPVGPLHAAAIDAGIVGLEMRTTDVAFAASVGARTRRATVPAATPGASTAARAHLAELEREIGEHLAGTRDAFDLPVVLEGVSDWDHRVLEGVRTIPRGATASYGEVARRIGKPGAARAVGGAVGRNPIGLLIPCHRVIAGDGTLGGYGGSWFGSREELLGLKERLLELEGSNRRLARRYAGDRTRERRGSPMTVLRAYRQLLRNGPLTRLLVGEFVSSIGDWLYLVAILILVYQVTEDPVVLGLVGAARVLPYIVLSVPAGIVADRFDRRLVLLTTDVARGVLMLVIAVIVFVDGPIWLVIVLAIGGTCFATFFGPAIGAYLPTLVEDEEQLGPANSAWSTLDNLAFMVGPAVAGILIATGGLVVAFLLNAGSFAIIAV